MDFEPSDKVKRLQARLREFMEAEIYPAEKIFERQMAEARDRWQVPPIMEELKAKARAAGLWNLFLPESEYGAGLTNLEYAPLVRDHGALADRAGSVQLLGPRHRQHGNAGALRHEGAAGSMAEAAAWRAKSVRRSR